MKREWRSEERHISLILNIDGIEFFISDNGVILTAGNAGFITPQYFVKVEASNGAPLDFDPTFTTTPTTTTTTTPTTETTTPTTETTTLTTTPTTTTPTPITIPTTTTTTSSNEENKS
jgi:hypothetical protein